MLKDVLVNLGELRLHVHQVCSAESDQLAILDRPHREHTAPLGVTQFVLILATAAPFLVPEHRAVTIILVTFGIVRAALIIFHH